MLPPRMYGGSGTRPIRSSSGSVSCGSSRRARHWPSSSRSIIQSFAATRPSRSRRLTASGSLRWPRLADKLPVPLRSGTKEEALPLAARFDPLAAELGRNHFGVVQDDAVATADVIGEVADVGVVDRPASAVDEHQPGVDPVMERLLGDEFGRKVVVEPGFHAGESPALARRKGTGESLQVYAAQSFSGYSKRREPWCSPARRELANGVKRFFGNSRRVPLLAGRQKSSSRGGAGRKRLPNDVDGDRCWVMLGTVGDVWGKMGAGSCC